MRSVEDLDGKIAGAKPDKLESLQQEKAEAEKDKA